MSLVQDEPVTDLRNGSDAAQADNTKGEAGPKESTAQDEEAGDGKHTPPTNPQKKTFIDVIREENEARFKPASLLPDCPVKLVRQEAIHRVADFMGELSDSSDEGLNFMSRPKMLRRNPNVRHMVGPCGNTKPTSFGFSSLHNEKENKTCEFLLKPLLFGWRGIDMIADSMVVCIVVFAWPAWVALLIIMFVRLPKINEAVMELTVNQPTN